MGNQREENERLVHDCAKCDLATQCKAPVPGHGNPNANVMFIGEAPGYHEDRSNRPFVGSSGSELDELYLPLARLERQDVWVDNVVRCKPRGNLDPPQESIDACKDHLDRSIALVDPEFVCLLGRTAVSAVLGEGYDLESWHGFPILGSDGKTYIPMYHPAFGLHSTDAMALIQNDFKSLRQILQGEWVTPREQYSDPDYREYDDYHIEWFKMYLNARPKIIAIDTETAEGEPWCLTFSGGPGHGVMIREGNPESLRVFQEYVNTYRPLILLHNSMFDIPVLRKMGLEFDFYLDTMVMAYLLQDQPQGLKPLAFRHAGMKMEAYWDIIGTATQDRALEYFEQVARREWTKPESVMYQDAKGTLKIKNPQALHKKAQRALKVIVKHEYLTDLLDTLETSSWSEPDTYTFIHAMWNTDLLKDTKNKKGAMPETLLATKEQLEDKLGRTSIPDLYKRWKDWKADDETWEAEAELGPLHPGNLGDVDPEIALTYACRDADATFRIYPILLDLLEERGLLDTLQTDMKTIPMVLDMQEGGWPVNRDHFEALTKEFTKVLLNLEDDISRQLRHKNGKMPRALRGFNPGSPAQVQKLLYEHLKLKNPTKKKSKITGEDSAADEVLQALAGAHPVIPLISEWRKYAKLISTYTTRIPRKMDKRGRVHPNIRITRTRTGRLACSNPNLQNIPTRSDEGRRIREGFICDSGCTLVSGDYSGVEMRVAAHLGNDREMIRMFNSGEDVHNQTASRLFGIPPDRIDPKKHRYPAKTAGFLTLFGGGPDKLCQQLNAKGIEGWTVDRCKEFLRDWFDLFHGIRDHRKDVHREARMKGYVSDMFGRIRLIPQVKSTLPYVREEGDRYAYSMAVQGSAQGIIKRGMGELVPIYREFKDLGYTCDPLIQIHDDLVFHVQDEIRSVFAVAYKLIMENIVTLSVPLKVDMAYGPTWASMEGEE